MSDNPGTVPLIGRPIKIVGVLFILALVLASCNPFDQSGPEVEPTVSEPVATATEASSRATPTTIQMTSTRASISAAATPTNVRRTATRTKLPSTPSATEAPLTGTPSEVSSTLTATEAPLTGTPSEVSSTLTATEVPLTGTPTVTEVPPTEPADVIYLVANTDGDGVNIRRATDDTESIKVWPDGTEMVVVGPDVTAEGRLWKNVRDPDGNVGFVAAEYLDVQQPAEATTTATVTPDAESAETTTTPDALEVTLFVGRTNGDGVYVRRQVDSTDRIKAWPDGTKLVVVGPAVAAAGRVWRNVRDPDGNVGFVPSEYLVDTLPTAVVEPDQTPTPEATTSVPTAAATATATATAAARATATATIAVAIPSLECASPAERPYLEALLGDYERTRQSLQAFGTLMNNAATNQSLLADPTWHQNVAGHLDSLRATATKIRDLVAPESVGNIQGHARNAVQNILAAVDLFESGLQNSNQSELGTATGHLQTANHHASQLQTELGQLCNR